MADIAPVASFCCCAPQATSSVFVVYKYLQGIREYQITHDNRTPSNPFDFLLGGFYGHSFIVTSSITQEHLISFANGFPYIDYGIVSSVTTSNEDFIDLDPRNYEVTATGIFSTGLFGGYQTSGNSTGYIDTLALKSLVTPAQSPTSSNITQVIDFGLGGIPAPPGYPTSESFGNITYEQETIVTNAVTSNLTDKLDYSSFVNNVLSGVNSFVPSALNLDFGYDSVIGYNPFFYYLDYPGINFYATVDAPWPTNFPSTTPEYNPTGVLSNAYAGPENNFVPIIAEGLLFQAASTNLFPHKMTSPGYTATVNLIGKNILGGAVAIMIQYSHLEPWFSNDRELLFPMQDGAQIAVAMVETVVQYTGPYTYFDLIVMNDYTVRQDQFYHFTATGSQPVAMPDMINFNQSLYSIDSTTGIRTAPIGRIRLMIQDWL